jgi:sugar diacid utilization regulator
LARRSPRRDAGTVLPDSNLLDGYGEIVLAVARTGRRLTRKERDDRRLLGRRAADDNVPLSTLVDGYLGATRQAWSDFAGNAGGGARDVTATLLRAANDAIVALADGYDDAQRSTIRAEEALRREFIDDLLHGSDPGRLAERAGQFGLHLAAHHVVAVVRDGPAFTDTDRRTRALAEAVRLRLTPADVLVTTKEGLLVCVIDGIDSSRLYEQLSIAVGHERPGTVGVGRSYRGPGGVARSFDDARTALDLTARLGVPARNLLGADLLVYQVLGRDRAAIEELVDTVLEPLQNARGGAGPLLDTLTAYLHTGNASAAARTLHLSVRALTYRLVRIHRLTGYDATVPEHRYMLKTAVLGARLLGWPVCSR